MRLAVLFDMNGVLVDDEALHEHAFRTALAEFERPLTHAMYRRHFAGRTDREGFLSYLAGEDLPLERLQTVKNEAYLSLAATGLRVYDDAVDLVHRLRHHGHPLALVTGAHRREAELVQQQLNLTEAFEVVVAAEDVREGKPSPEPFLKAAHLMKREPRECVVIEDSPTGVTAAHAAGMHCIAVTSTHSPSALKHAREIVTTLSEVTFP